MSEPKEGQLVNHETEPRHVERFIVLDLDRTLFKTTQFFEDACRYMKELDGVSDEQIEQFHGRVEALRGQDPDWVELLAEDTSVPEPIDYLQTRFLSLSPQQLREVYLYEGAVDLIDELASSDLPFVILTKGGPITQQLKLDVMQRGLGAAWLPTLITSSNHKAAWIEAGSYEQPNGLLLPQELTANEAIVAEQVVIVDDKSAHLATSNARITGMLVDNSADANSSAQPIGKVREQLFR